MVDVASDVTDFRKGDLVTGRLNWQELAIVPASSLVKRSPLPSSIKLSDYLGILGIVGQTAYWGLHDVGKIQKGQTVVVSGAAGGVGIAACAIGTISVYETTPARI